MADGTDTGATTTTTDAGNGGGGTTTDTSSGAGKTFTQDQVNDLIAREKGQIQSKFADYDDLKAAAAKLKDIEDANKSELEKTAGERDTFKNEKETLAQQNARLKVALKKGLVGDRAGLADLLQGKDEKELEAHADKLLKLMGGTAGATNFDGGAREGVPSGDMDTLIRRAAGRAV